MRAYFPITHSVNMITPMAIDCSRTRKRMSFCDVLPEPPHHHVDEAEQQHDRDRADGDRDPDMRHEICHGGTCSTVIARSEATKQSRTVPTPGLLRSARNDAESGLEANWET